MKHPARIARRWTSGVACAAMLVACSSNAPTRSHDPMTGGSGGSAASDAATGGGAGGASGSTGSPVGIAAAGPVCKPSGTGCDLKVQGGPAEGAGCLAMRNNASSDHVQLRQVWTHITAPVGNTIDLVYGTLQARAELPLSECNMQGVTGYIKLVDWDRSNPDIAQQTARVGWANFAASGAAAARKGLCFVELDYSAPSLGLTTPWAVKPVLQRRVAADFTVDDALRGQVAEGEGVFYFDESKATAHHYSRLEYVAIFDNADKVTVVPLHDAEMTIRYDDKALDCAGTYRAGSLAKKDDCSSSAQDNPPWGCSAGGCPAGEGPVETSGYFLITELEKVYSSVLDSTLCVSYPGQANSIASGWANPGAPPPWGLNCSGSPRWNPSDPVKGLPMGDFCSATHGSAKSDCHDAYKSHTFGAMSGFPVQAAACRSNALAAAKFTM